MRVAPQRRRHLRPLDGECLEERALPSASPLESAMPLRFESFNIATVSHFLALPDEFDLYSATLHSGDTVQVSVDTSQPASGLASLLRIFDANGRPLALDNQQGGDPTLTFQVATGGLYYIGVSSAPDYNYNPMVAASGTPGLTTGLYTLTVKLTNYTPLMPDMAGSSFRTGTDMAAPGDTVPVNLTVQNRGGADPGNFQVQVLLGQTNEFPSSSLVVATLSRDDLIADATGRGFSSPSGFAVTIPAGVASGPAFLGLRIVADPNAPESGLYDKSGVHRGVDWEPLALLTSAGAGAINLSGVDPDLYTETRGALQASGQPDTYVFTTTSAEGTGEIKAEVAFTNGSAPPRLSLFAANGQLLVQTDSGQLVQVVQPGTYALAVSSQTRAGSYRLTTSFVETSDPFSQLAAGAGTASVAVADVNGDGYPDIITANRIDQTVSVFLGNGDGTFRPPEAFAAGPRMWRVSVGDVTNDGRVDIITGNKGNNTVSILLGNGDGTFQPQIVIPAGTRVGGARVADVNGDGFPDLIEDNYAADSIWVLQGNGTGSFGPPTIYPTDSNGHFQGVSDLTVADVNGDGIPDLVYPNYIGADVVIRLGAGNGTFGPPVAYPTRAGSYQAAVVDLTGDGIPDIVTVNAVDNSVSVLLGKGNGTFAPEKVYPVGTNPYAMTIADVNGDGHPDIVTSNRNDNSVSVLLGTGDGTFQPAETFQTGKTPRRVAAADFNGDGQIDLAVADQGDNAVDVLRGNGDGTFSSGSQQAAPAPDLRPFQVAVADLNGDGRLDIVTANRSDNSVSVLLSNADGSYQTRETYATDTQPFSVFVADLNGDGIPDIVTANYAGSSVSVLLGNGDGTFQPHHDYPAGTAAYDAVVADVNGDGKPDIIVANKNDNTVGVLLGNGNGTFQPQNTYPVASGPYEVVAKDLTGNGLPDIVVSHFSATVVDVLMNNGDGTFQPAREYPVGSRPYGLAVADLSGDGIPDIVTANYRSSNVSILLGKGDGTFGPPQLIPVGSAPNEVQVADLNGDGIPDIVTANYGGNSVSVLLGTGNGTFRPQKTYPAGNGPASVAVADLYGDHIPDLIVGNRKNSTIQVLRGNGDGTFQPPVPFGLGKNRYSIAVADLNGDGKPDVVEAHLLQNSVTVELGDGTGSFEQGQTIAVGDAPTGVAIADLNGDGRPDLVVANSGSNTVSVVLGNGDGTFNIQKTYAVGRSPRSVAVADLNGDGIPDIVVANYNANTVSVLLGNGDGTFRAQETFAVGAKPYSVKVADLKGDGPPDIVTANAAGDTVSVLLGLGHGAFAADREFAVGRQPFGLAIADITGDGIPDLITANAFDGTVSVLLNRGDGTFQPQRTLVVGSRPYSVAAADVNGDGKPDLITTNYGEHDVSVLLNNGAGSFLARQNFPTDQLPVQSVVADVNGDGRPDLITASNQDSAIGVMLGLSAGSFQPVTAASGVTLPDTPFLADVNGDGIADSVVLDRSGNILFRKGLGGANGALAPPIILNPGRPARDIALLRIGSAIAIAAGDAHYDPTLSRNSLVFTVSLYFISPSGAITRETVVASPDLPVRLATANLAGNGLDSLIAANSLNNSITVALQIAPGRFAAPMTIPVGMVPSDIAVADLNGDGLPDIVVSDQASGDVTVLLNDPTHSFRGEMRFRASSLASRISTLPGDPTISSGAQTVGLVAGSFTGSRSNDIIVVNRGVHRLTLLSADGQGGLSDSSLALSTSTSDGLAINNLPGAAVAGDFNRDGKLDLAVLMEDTGQVWIYSGNGDGSFRHTYTIPVGDQATGLSVIPGPGPGLLDLLVGNGFGDVLHLAGKGDGTFQISGNRVSLSVVPNLLGPGQAGVLVGNQQNNSVTVQAPSAGGNSYKAVQTLSSSSPSSQLAPGDVHWAMLDKGSKLPDAVVVSTGSNAVVVYRTISVTDGVPVFAPNPRTYFVGTAPAGVTVADINGDGIPDMLVANEGSNDVSVLFGSFDATGNWVGIAGPRLKTGGVGPISVSVQGNAANDVQDLAVFNGGSGTVTLLPGVGHGFFDDRQPKTLFSLGNALVQPPTFLSEGGIGFGVTADGSLVAFDLSNPGAGARVVFSSQQVLAAQALPNGQVVVAVASGAVELLAPSGGSYTVQSVLQTEGGSVTLASAIEVVTKSSGQFDVLVSSQGSDTISVFGQEAAPVSLGAPVTAVSGSVGASSGASSGSSASSAQPVTALGSTTAATSGSSGASASASSSSSSSSSAGATAAAVATAAMGLSLGGFTSVGNGPTEETGAAMLVAVEGNTYLSVPILDFGSEGDEEAGRVTGRAPRTSTVDLPGDRSPLNRLIMGLDDAERAYRGAKEDPAARGEGQSRDPWNEDLFYLRRAMPRVPPIDIKSNSTKGEEGAMLPEWRADPLLLGFWVDSHLAGEEKIHEDTPLSTAATRVVAKLNAAAGMLAVTLLTPAIAVRRPRASTNRVTLARNSMHPQRSDPSRRAAGE
jgi:hypothetical protein